jgi:hypothetical protein
MSPEDGGIQTGRDMKKSGLLVVAILLSISAGAFAAETDFDQSVNDVLNTIEAIKAPPQGGFQPGGDHGGNFHPGGDHGGNFNPGGDHGGFQPGPGHVPQPPMPQPIPQPIHPQPQPPMPHPQPMPPQPGPGHDHYGPGGDHGGPGNNDWDHHGNDWDHHGNDWDHHPYQPPYTGPVNECSDWTFKADTPNPFTDKIYFYDYQGQIHDQKVTISIGQRDLKPWESEIITVCPGSLSQDKTLFNYSVTQKDNSGFGSFFTGTKSYTYTLTPTGRKAATPDSQGITMASSNVGPDGKVSMVLSDKWASYYQGQQITFNMKIMRIPENVQNMSAQDLLNALKETNVTATFPVSAQYQVPLLDQAQPGTYTVTVDYTRDNTGMSQIFSFKI